MTTGPNRHGYDWKPHPHPRGELPLDISIALVTTSNEQSDDLSGGAAPSLPQRRQEAHLPHRHRPGALPLATWVSFIRLMRYHVPVECAAELCGDTHKTAFEWRHRVLATVSGYQDRIVLRDTVWVDEIYVNDTGLSKGYGQAGKRGLPR